MILSFVVLSSPNAVVAELFAAVVVDKFNIFLFFFFDYKTRKLKVKN